MTFICLACVGLSAQPESYKYFRIGNKEDIHTKPAFAIAMMGGGSDLDAAFRWLCSKGNGGDFLILRAGGNDEYNSYVNALCKANSVATLILPDRATADDPAVSQIIRKRGGRLYCGRRSGKLHSRMEGNRSPEGDQ